ncbi:DNA repair protein RecO [Mycoplasma sp. NEAQ87857]|uniref:DNA repair protein RecO n=1 Tax=Mycoplasma sp. NEAQ87857 TaxID=2683967 RepID=UPI00131DC209|nr:DNA repair protein RecO [Mycoplasma sp. NEAQ87857]
MRTQSLEAIILNIKQIDNNLFLCSFLTQNGVLKLWANGLNKPNSKNKANLQIGAVVEIEYFQSRLKNQSGRLKKAHLIKYLNEINDSNLNLIMQLVKLFINIDCQNHLLNIYKQLIGYFNEKINKYLLIYFLAQSLIYLGICPNFDACRTCGSKRNLIDFELENGGFICNLHNHPKWLPSEVLNTIWSSFHDVSKYIIITDDKLNNWLFYTYKNAINNAGYYF